MLPDKCHLLIAGCGITGLTIAYEFLQRGSEDIVIIEKEPSVGLHASGRNSGVLHAGIYYTPDTLKAKYCVDGNRLMKEFCRQRGLTLRESGKVVVAKNADELNAIHELKRRADSSGARATVIDEKELREIEPCAATCGKALYSPDTAVINPNEILQALVSDLENSRRVKIFFGTEFRKISGARHAVTSSGVIQFAKFINAAGAYADRIAHGFGLAGEYKILPFKGTYKKLIKDRIFLVRGNIYPVPDLKNPFLGVHFTRSAENEVYVGPTAIPALGRENYGIFDGVGMEGFSILYRDAVLFLESASFRDSALKEIRKYFKKFIYDEAVKLIPQLRMDDLEASSKAGIRPQLIHWPTRRLVMDFAVSADLDSVHVLNAVSPAFTSSMAFAKHIASLLQGQ